MQMAVLDSVISLGDNLRIDRFSRRNSQESRNLEEGVGYTVFS